MSPFYCFSARVFLLAYLGAITLPSASRAQEDAVQCTSINDPDFDFQAIVQEGFEIKWTMDTTADTITFEVFNSVESWTAIGFSEDGDMIGSDAVIGLPANESVNEYNLTAKDVTAIDLFDDQEITNTTVVQDINGTMITFTRPFTPANSEKQTLSSTPGEEGWIIWAFGEDNELAYHSQNRGFFLLDLFCGETASGNMTVTPTAFPTDARSGPATPTASPISAPTGPATPTASPSSAPTGPATPTASSISPPSGPATPTASPSSAPTGPATPTASPISSPTGPATPTASTTSAPTGPATPTASPNSAPTGSATPTASTTPAPTGANSAGGVHGSFGAGSNGGGWWVTASTGLSALLGAALALSW